MPDVQAPTNTALLVYSVIGIVIGVLSALITKAVYLIEDAFEKLPIHWMRWPAIGGLVVGVVGYFAPETLGVGYVNIDNLLMGKVTLQTLFVLGVLKFISWSFSLGSGTSGGTLAPLLTIGGASGLFVAFLFQAAFPQVEINFSIAALIGSGGHVCGGLPGPCSLPLYLRWKPPVMRRPAATCRRLCSGLLYIFSCLCVIPS